MGRKKKVVKYREYFQKHTAEELFNRYRESVKKGSLVDIPAREEATKILNTVRMYEAYVQRIEKQYKRELNRTKRELRRALEKIKLLEKQLNQPRPGWYKINPLTVVNQPQAQQSKLSPVQVKATRLISLAERIEKRFNKHISEKIADNRGDDVGESVGRKSHESKDVYGDILSALEVNGNLYLSGKARATLATSSAFREAYQDWGIRRGLSAADLVDVWERNFGTSIGLDHGKPSSEAVNWSFRGLRNKVKK